MRDHGRPAAVVTDKAATLLRVVEELLPDACHDTQRYANNRVENDHGRLKARLRGDARPETNATASIRMATRPKTGLHVTP